MTRPEPTVGVGRARAARGGRLRRVVGRSFLLVRRRAARDAALLLALGALVALTALLAAAGPRLLVRVLDDATEQTVEQAGPETDPAVGASVAFVGEDPDRAGFVDPSSFLTIPRYAAPPPGLAAVTDEVVVSLDLGSVEVLAARGLGDGEAPRQARVAMLPDALADDVAMVAGRLPQESAGGAEVVVTEAAAERFGLAVGTQLDLAGPEEPAAVDPDTGEPVGRLEATPVPVTVVGVVAAVDPAARVWHDLRFVWEDGAEPTLLAVEEGTTELLGTLDAIGWGTVRTVLDPAAVTYERARALRPALEEVAMGSHALTTGLSGVWLQPRDLRPALDAHLAAAPAARAQMSVPQTGVVGVAGLVLVLVSRLLVRRRADAIALERARGASVPSVTFRLLAESVLVVGAGTAAGVAAAQRLMPGPTRDAWLLAVVVGVALVAAPLQGALLARRAWTGRREPANRRERDRLARRRAMRRVAAEVGVVVLAVGAGVSLRRRGLITGATESSDPFLAVAPLLVAVAMTVVALRLYPWPVRALARLGRRSRGVLGVLGAVRARRALAPLPLLALTVGTSVAVTGLLLVDTVRAGQVEASWERTGADARLDGLDAQASMVVSGPDGVVELDVDAAVARLRDAPGVDAVAVALTADQASFDLGAHNTPVSVLAVDPGYAGLLAGLPDPPADVADLVTLADGGDDPGSGRLPVVVDEALRARMAGDEAALSLRGAYLQLLAVGTTDHAPLGEAPGPFVYLDLATLGERLDDGPVVDTVWLRGPGAEAAAAEAADVLVLGPDQVHTRTEWLADRRAMALVSGVERIMLAATAAVGLLAILALVATVLAGARERGRTLSMLRTLGMRARLGWWLALAELAPVVAAAVVAGAAAGVVVVLLLGGTLGLDVLVGGVGLPTVTIAPRAIGWLALGAAVLLLAAALVEVAAHRRERLSDVLRVGETTT